MRKILLSVSALMIGVSAFSQQDFQFSQYMYDRLSFNPGYAGIDGKICGTAMFRSQWVGFEGAPQTFLFNAHGPVKKLHGGLGFSYFNDQLGQFNDNYARLSYSYHAAIPGGMLGIGISAGMVSKNVSANWISIDDYTQDNAIPNTGMTEMTYDLGFGVYYSAPTFYVGLSSTHLSESEITQLGYLNKRHYYVVAGYNYLLPGSGDWMLKPTILVKSDAASTQLDISVRALWKNMVWGGLSYRLTDAIVPIVGYQQPMGKNGMLKIGYSYDITTSEIKTYSNGSHEIMVNYCFSPDPPNPVHKKKTVRFL